jgi:hypothetical protein
MSGVVQVLFEVPDKILKGLANDSMVQRGGVIQWASGPERGQIVAWLRESGGLQSQIANAPTLAPAVGSQLGALKVGVNAVLGVQVLTLAVTAIGFLIINEKLKAISAKLDAISRQLAEVSRDLRWLDRREDVALRSRLIAAFDTAAWAQRTDRPEQLAGSRSVFVELHHHYGGLLDSMFDSGRSYEFPEVYNAYFSQLALAFAGRALVEGSLDGPEASAVTLREAASALEAQRDRFQAPFRDIRSNLPTMLALGVGKNVQLREAVSQMRKTEARIAGYESEYAFCARENVALPEWNRLGQDVHENQILLLSPT